MKIVRTFVIEPNCLWAVKIDKENHPDYSFAWDSENYQHELENLFEFWDDPHRLNTFFEENEDDLKDQYWDGMSIEDAILKTRDEAKQLRALLFEYAIDGKENANKNLSIIFRPLSKSNYDTQYEQDKLKLHTKKNWLRIYAIRIDVHQFIICGGAIKLRPTLNDRNYLIQELLKLKCTKAYIESDFDEIFELVP